MHLIFAPFVTVLSLVAVGDIYFSSHPSKPPTSEVVVQPSAQPTAPVAAVTPSPPVIATPTVEKKAPPTPEVAVQPSAQPTSPVAVAIPTPSISVTPSRAAVAGAFAGASGEQRSAPPSTVGLYAEAKRYLNAQNYRLALPLLQKAATGGNADAMNNLGDLYYYGHGVAQDYAQARDWYQKAAAAGNADAKQADLRLQKHFQRKRGQR